MAELATLARPYAEAAFAVAQENNALPVWSQMLRVAAAVAADPKVAQAMGSPKLTAAQKESMFLSVCGDRLDTGGRNFVRVLVEAGRIGLLPEIARLFDERKDSADGIARARIASALPLSEAQVGEIRASLEKKLGRRIEAAVEVDPALIGGAVVHVGDTVIDGSVRGKLAAMASHLRT